MIQQIEMNDWRQLQTWLVFIYDGPVHPTHRRLSHHEQGQSAIFLRQGSVTVRTLKGEMKARAGEWFFPRQGDRYQEFTEDAVVLSLRFILRWPGGAPLYDWDAGLAIAESKAPGLLEEAYALHAFIHERFSGNGMSYLYAKAHFNMHNEVQIRYYRWLFAFSEVLHAHGIAPSRIAHTDPRVLQVIQFLDHEPFDHPLRQKALAARVNLSPNQLNRLFMKHFRITPSQYFEQRKSEEAMARVQNSTNSFKEIAFDLGFNSPSHFSAWFMKKFQHSPRDYRAAHLEHLQRIPGSDGK